MIPFKDLEQLNKYLTRRSFLKGRATAAMASTIGCAEALRPNPSDAQVDNNNDTAATPEGPPTKPLQTLHIVGPNGSSSWFQQLWPHVEVAQADTPSINGNTSNKLPYHEAASAGTHIAAANGNNEWFASSKAPWMESGSPVEGMELTAMMTGRDETLSTEPNTAATFSGTEGLLSAIAAIQATDSNATLPVTGIYQVTGDDDIYGQDTGSPAISRVDDNAAFLSLYQNNASVDLTPTNEEKVAFGIDDLASVDLTTTQRDGLQAFGERAIMAAKALSQGLSDSVTLTLSNGPSTDTSWTTPLDAFNTAANYTRSRNVMTTFQNILNGFYEHMNAVDHPDGSGTRADHTLITIHGDTPKNSHRSSNWPDATSGDSANWIYVFAKGFLKQGWFGRVHVEANGNCSAGASGNDTACSSGFNGSTGVDDTNIASTNTTLITSSAIAYAVARGDSDLVKSQGGLDFDDYKGVVAD